MLSSSYESKLEELKEKLKRAKEGLRDSMIAGMLTRVANAGKYIALYFLT